MTFLTFPTLPSGQTLDSKKFAVELVDNTLRKDMDGGYTITRPRTTRVSRRTFTCGYTSIPETDKAVLDAFFTSVLGNAQIFLWISPQDAQTYSVRFKGNLKFQYQGRGLSQIWDCSFILEQA
jgi:hypothetical protein